MRRTSLLVLSALLTTAMLLAAMSPARASSGGPAAASLVPAAPADEWVQQSPVPDKMIDGVAFGNDRFVALAGNTALTSGDGREWTAHPLADFLFLGDLVFDGKEFLAVGLDGRDLASPPTRGIVATSVDGESWSLTQTGDVPPMISLAYGNGLFVASAVNGDVEVSADGRQWHAYPTGNDRQLLGLTYWNGQFRAIGKDGVTPWVSTDGTTWQKVQPGSPDGAPFGKIAAGRGLYLAEGGYEAVLASADGVVWSVHDLEKGQFLNAITYGKGVFVAVGGGNSPNGLILTTTDGIHFENWHTALTGNVTDLTYGNGAFVASTDQNSLWITRDGRKWRQVYQADRPIARVTWLAGRFFAAAPGGPLLTSADGEAWTASDTVSGDALDKAPGPIVWNGRRYAAATPFGLLSSADGLTWQEQRADQQIRDVTAGQSKFVAVGDHGTIRVSADGDSWESRTPAGFPTGEVNFNTVAFGGGRFLAAGTAGVVYTSTDGLAWQRIDDADVGDIRTLVYGNGYFVATTAKWVLSSVDGTDWRIVQPANPPRQLRYADGQFWLIDGDGVIEASQDGFHWKLMSSTAMQLADLTATAIAAGGGQVMAGGPAAQIWTRPARSCTGFFTDVPADHPACAAVVALAKRSIVKGYADATFGLNNPVRRAEFAKMLVTAMGVAPEPGPLAFADVAGHWAYTQGYLQPAVRLNAISGFPDGTFRPDAPISRAQLVKVVAASAGLIPAGSPPYTDIAATDWYAPWVAAARSAGLIGPDGATPVWGSDPFDGDQPATRAEAAILLSNFLDRRAAGGK